MKNLYLILAVLFYIVGVVIGYNQKRRGDQSKTSYFESRYSLISSLNPLGQPFFVIILWTLFLSLFANAD